MKTEQKLLLTREDVAYMLGISTKTVDEWRNDKRMQFPEAIRLGCRLRFSRMDIEAWIAALPRIRGVQKNYRNSYDYAFSSRASGGHA